MQDEFLNELRNSKSPVTVFLASGVKLQGRVEGFDNFVIILSRESNQQLIYKHSIATVVPAGGGHA